MEADPNDWTDVSESPQGDYTHASGGCEKKEKGDVLLLDGERKSMLDDSRECGEVEENGNDNDAEGENWSVIPEHAMMKEEKTPFVSGTISFYPCCERKEISTFFLCSPRYLLSVGWGEREG
jgi:hypothetical protein